MQWLPVLKLISSLFIHVATSFHARPLPGSVNEIQTELKLLRNVVNLLVLAARFQRPVLWITDQAVLVKRIPAIRRALSRGVLVCHAVRSTQLGGYSRNVEILCTPSALLNFRPCIGEPARSERGSEFTPAELTDLDALCYHVVSRWETPLLQRMFDRFSSLEWLK